MNITITNGQSTISQDDDSPQSFTSGSDIPNNAQGLDSARNPSNNSRVGNGFIKEDTLVMDGGIQMSAKDAVNLGQFTKNADGNYTDNRTGKVQGLPADEPITNEQQEPEAPPAPTLETFNPADENFLSEMTDKVQEVQTYSAVNFIASGKDIPAGILKDAANALQVEPHELDERIEYMRDTFTNQAAETISKSGLDPQEVFDWANREAPQLMSEAITKQFHQRSTKGYAAVVNAYAESLAETNPDMILNANFGDGITASRGSNGTIILTTPQGQFSWKAAVKAGIVNLSRG